MGRLSTPTTASTSLIILAVQIQIAQAGITNWLWSGVRDRNLATVPCITGGFVLEFDNDCNFENLKTAYAELFNDDNVRRSGCSNTIDQDLSAVLGVAESEMEQKVVEICHAAQDNAHQIPLSNVPGEDATFIRDYYNGRTYWNEHRETLLAPASDGETPAYVLKEEAVRVLNYYDDAQEKRFEWPGETASSFDSCQLNAAMCCYAADRQAKDNNGDCNDPYDENCLGDADPKDNTDLCMIDLSNAPQSNSVESDGFTFFDGDKREGEAAVHCHGFGWSDDAHDTTARYKANNLFYVSMYDHMYKRGYVRNIPGAPMCGCLEQMPVVTRSDCTQVDVTENYRFVHKDGVPGFDASVDRATIEFNSCQGTDDRNNDLLHYLKRLESEGSIATSTLETVESNHILGHSNKCYDKTLETMLEQGYMWAYEPDPNEWATIDGIGELRPETPVDDPLYFKEILSSRTNPIIRRVCPNCVASHRDIYYKRLTPVPDDMDILDYMKNKWLEEHNVMGTDFNLFSSYADAVNDANPWEYCNYGYVGFPRDCGPGGYVGSNWNRWYGDTNKYNGDVAFYVEANPPFPTSALNNVAKGKLTYQISTGWRGRPDKAVDGNFNGYWWPDQSITHTRESNQPWFEVFLENDDVKVSFVALFNRMDSRSERLSDVTVDLLDGPGGSIVATQKHAGAVGGMAYFKFDNVSAQAVRVTIAASGTYLSLAEIFVNGEEVGTSIQNIAQGKPASQATTYSDFTAARAVDGKTTGDWGDYSMAHTSWSSINWWMVDLQGSYPVLKVIVFNRNDCCQDRMKNLKIELLDVADAENGNVIATQSLTDGAYPDPFTVFEFTNVSGAAVKLTAESNVLNIAEVVVLSESDVAVTAATVSQGTVSPSVPAVDVTNRVVLAPSDDQVKNVSASSISSVAMTGLATPASAPVLSPADRYHSGIVTADDEGNAEGGQVKILFADEGEIIGTIDPPKLVVNPSAVASVVLSPADRMA